MKCTEVSLQHILFLIWSFFAFVLLLQVVVYLNIFFRSCYPYIQLGTVQNYSHDDKWQLAVQKNDKKKKEKDKARHFEVRAMSSAKAALKTAFGF